MSIIEATRGHITVQCGDKSVTVWGELLGQEFGKPDYQIYGDAVTAWDSPNETLLITQEEKDAILKEVCDYLRQLGRTPVVLG